MELTVILLKPDCVQRNLIGEVIGRFEKSGLKVRACKMMQLTDSLLKDHYSHLADKPFFPEIAGFMKSAPVVAMILEGENVIVKVRDMVGPTDSTKAPKGSIRGDLGKTKMENIVHASDTPENAAAEVKRFFKQEEIF
ncbi:MAG TPA: nucleoside-diphosphate kinase [Verrucomicrobiae bacterium]